MGNLYDELEPDDAEITEQTVDDLLRLLTALALSESSVQAYDDVEDVFAGASPLLVVALGALLRTVTALAYSNGETLTEFLPQLVPWLRAGLVPMSTELRPPS